MKRHIYLYFLFFLSLTSIAQCDFNILLYTYDPGNLCDENPWVTIFEDNFNGNSIDLSVWHFGPHIRYCNDEQQYYTNGSNIEVSNGNLKLVTKEETIYAKAVDWMGEYEHLYCQNEDGEMIDKGQNLRYFYYTSANVETI